MPKKEIFFYALGALGALYILGYSVHMLLGGLVSPRTEKLAIAAVVGAGVVAVALMAWDVAKRRRPSGSGTEKARPRGEDGS